MNDEQRTNLKNGLDNEDVATMLEWLSTVDETTRKHRAVIERIQQLITVDVSRPKPNTFMRSLQPWQIVNRLDTLSTRPSVTYHLTNKETGEAGSDVLAQIVRDGVKTVQEQGGYLNVLNGKISVKREAINYGDGHTRISVNRNGKIVWQNVQVGAVYVDNNAVEMHGEENSMTPKQFAIIYVYDSKNAKDIANTPVGSGRIPTTLTNGNQRDLQKTNIQQDRVPKKIIECIHYWDIRDEENPIYIEAWGEEVVLGMSNDGEEYPLKGDDYPFIHTEWRNKDGKMQDVKTPYIPVGNMHYSPSVKGYFNDGILGILYKYIISRQDLWNKHFGETIRSMSDIGIIHMGKGARAKFQQQMLDAKKRLNKGERAIIYNDSGERYEVDKLEKTNYEQGLVALKGEFDMEILRFGINLNIIRTTGNVTATQINDERNVEEETVKAFIERNIGYWKANEQMTIDFILQFIDEDDQTPIRSSAVIPKKVRDEAGEPVISNITGLPEIELKENGEPEMEELKGLTFGTVKQLLVEHALFFEFDLRSGIRQSDSSTRAKALGLLSVAGGNPEVTKQAQKMWATSIGISIDEDKLGIGDGKVSQAGIKQAAEVAV